MTPTLSRRQRWRHRLIRSRWQRWLLPLLCASPYVVSLLWLVCRGQLWIAQILLTPVLMGGALVVLSLWLAHREFRA